MGLDTAVFEYFGLRTLWALAVTLVAILLARWSRAAAVAALRRHRAKVAATTLVGDTIRLLVLLGGLLVVVAIFSGEAFAWVLGSFSVLGIVVGLSLQDILRNFFAGVWILVEQPIHVGDTIEVDGHTGVVEEIAFRTTRLRGRDGQSVLVPNGALMTNSVVNRTR